MAPEIFDFAYGASAISSISATKFVVWGSVSRDGFDHANNHDFVFDLKTHKMHKIRQQEMNLKFFSMSYSVWIGGQRHMTLGRDRRDQIHLVQM